MTQRIIMIAVILVIVLGGGLYAYKQLVPPVEQETQGPVYSTEPVARGNISVGVDTTGQLNPSRSGGIRAPGFRGSAGGAIEYVIDEYFVEEGDEVKKGQVIARLEAPNLESEIESLEERLQTDREMLAELVGISVDEIDRINPSHGITLRASIDGRVRDLVVKEGDELKQGQIVARIVDDSRFKLFVKLYPAEFNRIKKGQKVALKFSAFDDIYYGEITDVNPNPVPLTGESDTARGFVYWITVEGENPGLVAPGIEVYVGIPAQNGNETSVDWFANSTKVESFVKEEKVLSTVEAIATEVHVRDMELVKKGDPLISMAGSDVQQMIQEKLDEIYDKEAELNEYRSKFNELEIKAPMDGIVAALNRQVDETVSPGEWLGYIYNTSDMRMWVQVDDIDVLLVKQGAPVKVTVDALPGEVFEGEVMRVATMGEDVNGIPRFSVDIQVKGGPQLKPGMQAHAYIDAGSAENVLLVPLEAIFEEDGKSKVEILNPDGTTKVVTVKLGLMNDRVAEVKSGVEEGELVITGSSADLLPSQHIGSQDTLLPGKQNSNNGQNGPENKVGPIKTVE